MLKGVAGLKSAQNVNSASALAQHRLQVQGRNRILKKTKERRGMVTVRSAIVKLQWVVLSACSGRRSNGFLTMLSVLKS